MSSAYFPQSNGRAELGVKTSKRLLRSNTGPTGCLDHDRVGRAMLQLRNTRDPDSSLSPAQIILGRPLRDSLSFVNRLEKYSKTHMCIQPGDKYGMPKRKSCAYAPPGLPNHYKLIRDPFDR